MLMLNIGGGMVGGDRLNTQIVIGDNAHALLTTASASKAYRTRGAVAVQHSQITLGAHAILEYLPDHLIPYAGAMVDQQLRVEMAPGSRALIYDAMAAGRVGRGERWQFRSVRSDIAVISEGRPIYLSRTLITPESQPLEELGWMEEANYLATMIVAEDEKKDWSSLVNAFDQALQAIPGVCGGASAMARGGCVARFISLTAHGLNRAAHELWGIARRAIVGRDAFPLRKL
jgi:urease accessory protein